MENLEVDENRQTPPNAAELAADGKMEALLDQALSADPEVSFPPDFTARILERRPFAPWEVRRAATWKGPLLVFFGLLLASAALFVLPVLRLGPGSALALWAWVTLSAVTRPLTAAVAAFRLLPEAGSVVKGALSGAASAALGAGALVSLATGALLVRKQGKQAARVPSR